MLVNIESIAWRHCLHCCQWSVKMWYFITLSYNQLTLGFFLWPEGENPSKTSVHVNISPTQGQIKSQHVINIRIELTAIALVRWKWCILTYIHAERLITQNGSGTHWWDIEFNGNGWSLNFSDFLQIGLILTRSCVKPNMPLLRASFQSAK